MIRLLAWCVVGGVFLAGCSKPFSFFPPGGSGGGTFGVKGKLVSTSASGLKGLSQDVALGSGKTVTHILAVNPSSGNPQRVLTPVSADGSFELTLDPNRPWILVFVDSSRVGADMIAGIFKAGTLDALTPLRNGGSTDLGNLSIASQTASSSLSYETLLTDLGLSDQTADFIGQVDGLCLRYVNPDIDGNGQLDAQEEHAPPMLDFHVQLPLRRGDSSLVTLGDMAVQFLDPSSTTISYGGTGINVSYPKSWEPADPATGTAHFSQTLYYMSSSGFGVLSAAPGTVLSGDAIHGGAFYDSNTFGISAEGGAGHDMPQGEYVFQVGSRTMTFVDVSTRSDADLTAGTNFILPFIRFVQRDAACVSHCAVGSVDYRWMKHTPSGWTLVTAEELSLVVSDTGGYLSIRPHHDAGSQNIGLIIPASTPSGTLSWSETGNILTGITDAEMQTLTLADLCHVGLSYDDKLGMRLFAGIQNELGTCL